MSSIHTTATAFTDLEIHLLPLEPEGYPVEITAGGGQPYPRGHPQADPLPWTPDGPLVRDSKRFVNLPLAQDPIPVETSRRLTRAFYRRLLHHAQGDLTSHEARSPLLSEGEAQKAGRKRSGGPNDYQ